MARRGAASRAPELALGDAAVLVAVHLAEEVEDAPVVRREDRRKLRGAGQRTVGVPGVRWVWVERARVACWRASCSSSTPSDMVCCFCSSVTMNPI